LAGENAVDFEGDGAAVGNCAIGQPVGGRNVGWRTVKPNLAARHLVRFDLFGDGLPRERSDVELRSAIVPFQSAGRNWNG
jgi:hypothetical protein